MSDVGIIEAWKLWFSGHALSDATVWGISVLWWGRIGKLLQFVGAAAIVAEIIGVERIHRFGKSFLNIYSSDDAARQLQDTINWLDETSAAKSKKSESPPKGKKIFRPLLWYSVIAIAAIYPTHRFVSFLVENLHPADPEKFSRIVGGNPYWFFFLGFYVLDVLVACVGVTLLASRISIAIGSALDLFLFRPIAWLLEHPYIDKWVKLAALILLLVGFHFDLLAS